MNGSVASTATNATSPITVTGLTDGATYTIGVYATNSVGNSGEALAGSVVPLGLPSQPTDVTATTTPGGISVSFGAPISTGGAPIDSYTVTSTDGSVRATGITSPILMTGLTNGITYVFTVHATTRAGSGPESAPTNPIHWTSTTALSPPLLPSAVPGNQQATISFLPPLNNGGSPVLSYTVTSNPGGLTATGGASPITVTGLTNGVSYTFTVVAANANGSSQPSTPSNAVTPMVMVPSQPSAPVASASNQGAIVSITPPSSDGGSPITAYAVTSNPGGITATGTGTSIAVTGLTNGVSYTFTVVATNAVGNSQPSLASNVVTPSVAPPPVNDNFANAQVITGSSGTVTGTNVNATTEAGEPAFGGASVWYAWTATTGGVLQIDTCGSSFTPLVAAYTGNTVNALTRLASGTVGVVCGATGTTISGIQVTLPPNGSTIYIAVAGGTPTARSWATSPSAGGRAAKPALRPWRASSGCAPRPSPFTWSSRCATTARRALRFLVAERPPTASGRSRGSLSCVQASDDLGEAVVLVPTPRRRSGPWSIWAQESRNLTCHMSQWAD